MQHAVTWVCIGIQFHTTTHIRTIRNTGDKHLSLHHSLAIHIQSQVWILVLRQRPDECKEIVNMVTTNIILQLLCPATYHRLNAKSQRIDEIAMMLYIVAPVSHAAHINRLAMSFKEYIQRTLKIFIQSPVTCKIIARTAWHQSKLYLRALLRRDVCAHNTVDYLAERTITA